MFNTYTNCQEKFASKIEVLLYPKRNFGYQEEFYLNS